MFSLYPNKQSTNPDGYMLLFSGKVLFSEKANIGLERLSPAKIRNPPPL